MLHIFFFFFKKKGYIKTINRKSKIGHMSSYDDTMSVSRETIRIIIMKIIRKIITIIYITATSRRFFHTLKLFLCHMFSFLPLLIVLCRRSGSRRDEFISRTHSVNKTKQNNINPPPPPPLPKPTNKQKRDVNIKKLISTPQKVVDLEEKTLHDEMEV